MESLSLNITNENQLNSLYSLLQKFPPIFVLQGDLGAGKTTLVRHFIHQIDPDQIISSPTFTLLNIYYVADKIINHYDLYRLSGEAEALEWGFDESLSECDYAFIEWAERVPNYLPHPHTLIQIQYGQKENERSLTISCIS